MLRAMGKCGPHAKLVTHYYFFFLVVPVCEGLDEIHLETRIDCNCISNIEMASAHLLGCMFLVRTNQRSLKCLLEQRLVASEYQKWITKLLGYDFDIVYRPSLENIVAGALF